MKVLNLPEGVALIYEWDRHNELRALLAYLIKSEARTIGDTEKIEQIEAMIVARLGYLPQKKMLK